MILIFLDGVMRNQAQTPIYEGVALYKVLKESNKLSVLCAHTADAERWLKLNNMGSIDEAIDHTFISGAEEKDKDLRLVEYCRSKGKVELVITADVELAKYLLEEGLHVLLFLHPTYLRPEFRPDGRGRKAWAAITDELDRQVDMFSSDARVEE